MLSLPIASSSSISFSSQPRFPIFKSSFNGAKIQHISTIRVPPQTASFRNPSSSVVMMAKREEEMNEIRAKTTEEINEEVVDLKGELLMLRLQKSARNEFKSSEFRRMRKRVLSLSSPSYFLSTVTGFFGLSLTCWNFKTFFFCSFFKIRFFLAL